MKILPAILSLLFLSACCEKKVDYLPADQFSCVSGGEIIGCLNEVNRMGLHEVPKNTYYSAGNFILLNATCLEDGSKFAFHSVFRVSSFYSKIIGEDYKNAKIVNEDHPFLEWSEFTQKTGAILVRSLKGNEDYKKAFQKDYPKLVEHLEKNGALNFINKYFVLNSKEISELTNLPICVKEG